MGSNASDAPLIGLTTYVEPARRGVWDEMSALVPLAYVSAVIRSGGTPLLLPPSPARPEAVLTVLSGLVVTGGPDVDPASYAAVPHATTDRPRPERDAWESALSLAALDAELPLLAICRGLQVLNVALGGTLHQHVPDVTGTDTHRPVPGTMSPNAVTVDPASTLAGIVGTTVEGQCHHHQAIDRVGRGLRVVGRAGDGIIEAVEVAASGFAIGVQWHPESNDQDDRLFTALARAAGAYERREGTRR